MMNVKKTDPAEFDGNTIENLWRFVAHRAALLGIPHGPRWHHVCTDERTIVERALFLERATDGGSMRGMQEVQWYAVAAKHARRLGIEVEATEGAAP